MLALGLGASDKGQFVFPQNSFHAARVSLGIVDKFAHVIFSASGNEASGLELAKKIVPENLPNCGHVIPILCEIGKGRVKKSKTKSPNQSIF